MPLEQLDFFQPTPDEINAKRIEEVFERCERVRKGTYAHIGEIRKLILEIKDDLEHMKRAICRGTNEN